MEKILIAVSGTAHIGKSSAILAVLNNIENYFPQADVKVIIPGSDVKALVKINNIVIGIESQGDPNSRLKESLQDFAAQNCDIIVCASRTSGMTVDWIDNMFTEHKYGIIWTSNYFSNELGIDFLNNAFAESIHRLIEKLINSKSQGCISNTHGNSFFI